MRFEVLVLELEALVRHQSLVVSSPTCAAAVGAAGGAAGSSGACTGTAAGFIPLLETCESDKRLRFEMLVIAPLSVPLG